MFKKPFVVKKNTNMRNSEVRKLLHRLPSAVTDIFDKNVQIAHVKLMTFNNVAMNIYMFDKNPMFFDFDLDDVLYPAVYFSWKLPTVFPTIVVHEPVFSYLQNGADLMLPGIIRDQNFSLPQFQCNAPVTISVYNNGKVKGPLAVGVALMSSQDMMTSGFHGKGVQILHIFRDFLWEFGVRHLPPTHDSEDLMKCQQISQFPGSDDFPPLETLVLETKDETVSEIIDLDQLGADCSANYNEGTNKSSDPSTVNDSKSIDPIESMEDLLFRCFLAALKFRLTKSGTIPIDVGQFYLEYLLPCVPKSKRIDMKKTKYKKFGVFLDEVNKGDDGVIVKIMKKGKGADVISEVNWSHPALRIFKPTDEITKDDCQTNVELICGPKIYEYFSVTKEVMPLMKMVVGVTKGQTLLDSSDLRHAITCYVKTQKLNTGMVVKLDSTLMSIIKHEYETIDWNTLIQKIQSKMTKTYVLRLPDGRELVQKIKPPKIVLKVQSRSGNKKVTLIENLTVFGIDPKNLCHQIRVGVAASATITGEMESQEVLVQGNQVAFIGDLLINEYGIEKKYIDGLALAPKKKR